VTVLSLQCNPASVTRGQSVTCTAGGVSAGQVTGWSFSGSNLPGPTGTLTWSGIMVAAGTVTVTAGGRNASKAITVNPRSWTTQPVAPTNAYVPACSFPNSPPLPSDSPGCSTWTASWTQPSLTEISSGPNNGFAYFATQLNLSQSFPYQIHPDYANIQSDFMKHQYGACGIIKASDLNANVVWHESSSMPHSHYNQYVVSLSKSDNNLGSYFEAHVAAPGVNRSQFSTDTSSHLSTMGNTINNDAKSETNLYGPNYNQSNGQFEGYTNYPPYATCN
jgi:hypothetical protein